MGLRQRPLPMSFDDIAHTADEPLGEPLRLLTAGALGVHVEHRLVGVGQDLHPARRSDAP